MKKYYLLNGSVQCWTEIKGSRYSETNVSQKGIQKGEIFLHIKKVTINYAAKPEPIVSILTCQVGCDILDVGIPFSVFGGESEAISFAKSLKCEELEEWYGATGGGDVSTSRDSDGFWNK